MLSQANKESLLADQRLNNIASQPDVVLTMEVTDNDVKITETGRTRRILSQMLPKYWEHFLCKKRLSLRISSKIYVLSNYCCGFEKEH